MADAVWDEAAARFDEAELAALVCTIAAINTWNRLQITVRAEPGHYRPGDLARAPSPAGADDDGAAQVAAAADDGEAR